MCCTILAFSASVKNAAVEGESGIRKKVATPSTTVTQPRTTNIILQPWNDVLVTCWKAKDRRPPIT
jgi:hypothetical protein